MLVFLLIFKYSTLQTEKDRYRHKGPTKLH